MTDRDDDLVDADLAKAWREASHERTPAELDRRVLQAARRAVPRRRGFLPAGWYRPLAYAATLVLGVALVLDVTNRQPEPGTLPATVAKPAPAAEAAADADSADVATRAATGARRQEDSPAREETPAPDAETRQRFEKSAENAGRALSEIAATAPAASREEREADGRACDADSRATPAAWWRCIEALGAGGRAQAAADERRLLEERFPGFEVPE